MMSWVGEKRLASMRRSAKGWNDAADRGSRHPYGGHLLDSGQGESQEGICEVLYRPVDFAGDI